MVGPLTINLGLCLATNLLAQRHSLKSQSSRLSSHIAGIESPYLWVSQALSKHRQKVFFSVLFFSFCTSVFVLRFPYFSIFNLPIIGWVHMLRKFLRHWNFKVQSNRGIISSTIQETTRATSFTCTPLHRLCTKNVLLLSYLSFYAKQLDLGPFIILLHNKVVK